MDNTSRRKEKSIKIAAYLFVVAQVISIVYLLFLAYSFFSLSSRYPTLILTRIITEVQNFSFQHPKTSIWICIFGEIVFIGILIYLSRLSYRWLSRNIDIATFFSVEKLLIALRANVYCCVICTVIVVSQRVDFRSSRLFGILAAVHLIPLALCSYQTLFRTTFREWPNFALAVSACLEYFAFLIHFYPNTAILGFVDGTKILEVSLRLTTFLAGGTLITVLAAILSDAIKEAFAQASKSGESKLSNFKNVRIRLLTHTPFHSGNKIPLISSQIVSVIIYLIVCCASIILPLTSTNNASPLPISFYLGILGTSMFILGVATHFYASDESILKSEYSYAYYRVKNISAEDIWRQTAIWKDYCQVVSNIYCSHSGLISEDEYLHHLWYPALEQLKNSNNACDSQFFSDMVYTHNGTYDNYNSSTDDSYIVNNKKIAVDIIRYIRDGGDSSPTNKKGIIDVLFYATHCYFSDKERWERRFRAIQLTTDEAISVLFLDVCNIVVHEKSQIESGCRVSSYCDVCFNDSMHNCPDAFFNRAELLLSFPFIIQKCIEQRWGQNRICIENPSAWRSYYNNMLSSPYQTTADCSLLDDICRQWITYSHNDLKKMDAFLKQFCVETFSESLSKSTSNRIFLAKEVIEHQEFSINSHEYYNTSESVRKYARQLIYFIFYKQS